VQRFVDAGGSTGAAALAGMENRAREQAQRKAKAEAYARARGIAVPGVQPCPDLKAGRLDAPLHRATGLQGDDETRPRRGKEGRGKRSRRASRASELADLARQAADAGDEHDTEVAVEPTRSNDSEDVDQESADESR